MFKGLKFSSNLKIFINFALIGSLLFSWLLKVGYFFSDDFGWLWYAQEKHGLIDIVTQKMLSFYSPVMNLFYFISYRAFHYQVAYYFLFIIVVHIIATCVVYLLLTKLIEDKRVAWWGAVFFLLAGSAYEPLFWVAANLHAVASLFIVLAVYWYWLFLAKNNLGRGAMALLFFILAIGTKEIAVVTAPLMILTAVAFFLKKRGRISTWANGILVALILSLSGVYAYFEYLWNHHSLPATSGYWQLDFFQFIRWPVIIVDMLVPLFRWINESNHYYLYGVCFLAVVGLIYFLRKSLIFYYGLLWVLIASLPTIFAVDRLWMPLSSRYTYLPRIGIIIILAVALRKLFSLWPRKCVYLVIVLLFSYNIFYWLLVAHSDYPYVYQTGRSLKQVVEQVGTRKTDKVYMLEPYPFWQNYPMVVGAFSTLIGLPEARIIFVPEEQAAGFKGGVSDAVIYWDRATEKYYIK
ncbi:MAG: hypothetical protein V1846_03665 [Candidatus Komeilibacteria bacterium]